MPSRLIALFVLRFTLTARCSVYSTVRYSPSRRPSLTHLASQRTQCTSSLPPFEFSINTVQYSTCLTLPIPMLTLIPAPTSRHPKSKPSCASCARSRVLGVSWLARNMHTQQPPCSKLIFRPCSLPSSFSTADRDLLRAREKRNWSR